MTVTPLSYDPRGLLWCPRCGVMALWRTLRENSEAWHRHPGHGLVDLRGRRPGWRRGRRAGSRDRRWESLPLGVRSGAIRLARANWS